MAKANFQAASALREHMLEGHRVSLLEAMLLFGVQNPNAEFARLKKDGFLVKSQKVAMAKIVRRINLFLEQYGLIFPYGNKSGDLSLKWIRSKFSCVKQTNFSTNTYFHLDNNFLYVFTVQLARAVKE